MVKLTRQLINAHLPATTGSFTSEIKLTHQLFSLMFRLKSASIEPETRLLMWVIGLLRGINERGDRIIDRLSLFLLDLNQGPSD